MSITILDKKWRELEGYTLELIALGREGDTHLVAYLQGKAAGYAEIIAEFMRPFYNDPITQEPNVNLVLKETMVRIKERKSGNTEYVSPGQEARQFEFPSEAPVKNARSLQIEAKLTDAEKTACKIFFQNGFTIEQIAESLDVPIFLVRKELA